MVGLAEHSFSPALYPSDNDIPPVYGKYMAETWCIGTAMNEDSHDMYRSANAGTEMKQSIVLVAVAAVCPHFSSTSSNSVMTFGTGLPRCTPADCQCKLQEQIGSVLQERWKLLRAALSLHRSSAYPFRRWVIAKRYQMHDILNISHVISADHGTWQSCWMNLPWGNH